MMVTFKYKLLLSREGSVSKYVDGEAAMQNLKSVSGADFTKGLKSRFRLKSKTLVLNFVKTMLSLWS